MFSQNFNFNHTYIVISLYNQKKFDYEKVFS